MTDSQNDDSMYENLSARLDEIFGVDEEGGEEFEAQEGRAGASPLQDLNAIVLTLEWEITDEVMVQLLDQVENLKDTFKDDQIAFSLLRLLGSVGKYVQSRRADAHPSALNLLNSLHTNLVKVVESDELSRADKSALLQSEVKKFKQLKQVIAQEKGRRASEPGKPLERSDAGAGAPSPAAESEADQVQEPVQEAPASQGPSLEPTRHQEGAAGPAGEQGFEQALSAAVEDIKQTIQEELQALREEIRSWKGEQ